MSPITEAQLLKLMVDTHGARFDGRIWDVFDDEIVPELGAEPNIVDLGCGPGLFLFDLCQRLPVSRLHGVDSSEIMLEVASNLSWTLWTPQLERCHLTETIPLESGSMDLVAMNFFLHHFDFPLPILADVLRILKPGGFVWLYDWARRPLEEYLGFWDVEPGLPGNPVDQEVAYKLFASHNRFTREDWQFVLSRAGLKATHELTRASGQHLLMVLKRKSEVEIE